MSGGSWQYVYHDIRRIVERLEMSGDPMRRALATKLEPFVEALHDIEWVDSGDYGREGDREAIKAALGENWRERTLAELVEEHKQLLDKWEELTDD